MSDETKEYPPLSYEEVLVRIQESIDFMRMKRMESSATENDKRYYGRMIRGLIQTKTMMQGYHSMLGARINGDTKLKDTNAGEYTQ